MHDTNLQNEIVFRSRCVWMGLGPCCRDPIEAYVYEEGLSVSHQPQFNTTKATREVLISSPQQARVLSRIGIGLGWLLSMTRASVQIEHNVLGRRLAAGLALTSQSDSALGVSQWVFLPHNSVQPCTTRGLQLVFARSHDQTTLLTTMFRSPASRYTQLKSCVW